MPASYLKDYLMLDAVGSHAWLPAVQEAEEVQWTMASLPLLRFHMSLW